MTSRLKVKPKLRVVGDTPPLPRTRVCNIAFVRDEAHEFRCIQAIRNRQHPQWSRSFSDFRVTNSPRLRKV